ncbi:metal-dependent hydrolase [Geotalea uraniireducens]|uniref:Metal-dependent hydrolase n=1 Tax=Geotalea uraniireducens TaxID=351604 RepID=A0ABM8ELG2_9BACT|nr:amidohydrolase family protein [Geotalea uraniireducens]BDV43276.1 metal-dependent hydrolase [Geotalea uraniireducens]
MELFSASYLLPVSSPPVAGGAIAVANGRIVAVGALDELRKSFNAPVHDFPGCAIVPGLVNAHTHLELTHFPSWKLRKDIDYSPRTYVDWIIQVIKIRRALTPQELQLSVGEGIRICLEAGTTAVGEILSDPSLLPLYAETPLSGRICFEAIGQDPATYAPLTKKLHGLLASFPVNRVSPALSPHAPHTLSADFHREISRLAEEFKIPRLLHLAESAEEVKFYFDSTGRIAELLYPQVRWEQFVPAPRRTTPTAWLEELGVLNDRLSAVHCVHLTPNDAEILQRHGVRVVLCPRSNDKLDVGKAPHYLFKKLGLILALGTDSLASNDSLSLWDEMRYILNNSADVFEPAEVFRMATLGSASALHLEKAIGSLEQGKCADFVVVRLPGVVRAADIYPAIVHAGELVSVYPGGQELVSLT